MITPRPWAGLADMAQRIIDECARGLLGASRRVARGQRGSTEGQLTSVLAYSRSSPQAGAIPNSAMSSTVSRKP